MESLQVEAGGHRDVVQAAPELDEVRRHASRHLCVDLVGERVDLGGSASCARARAGVCRSELGVLSDHLCGRGCLRQMCVGEMCPWREFERVSDHRWGAGLLCADVGR